MSDWIRLPARGRGEHLLASPHIHIHSYISTCIYIYIHNPPQLRIGVRGRRIPWPPPAFPNLPPSSLGEPKDPRGAWGGPWAPPGPPRGRPPGPPGAPPCEAQIAILLWRNAIYRGILVERRRKKERRRRTRRQNRAPFQPTRTGAETYSRARKPLTPINIKFCLKKV